MLHSYKRDRESQEFISLIQMNTPMLGEFEEWNAASPPQFLRYKLLSWQLCKSPNRPIRTTRKAEVGFGQPSDRSARNFICAAYKCTKYPSQFVNRDKHQIFPDLLHGQEHGRRNRLLVQQSVQYIHILRIEMFKLGTAHAIRFCDQTP